jgi:hypothetical protein
MVRRRGRVRRSRDSQTGRALLIGRGRSSGRVRRRDLVRRVRRRSRVCNRGRGCHRNRACHRARVNRNNPASGKARPACSGPDCGTGHRYNSGDRPCRRRRENRGRKGTRLARHCAQRYRGGLSL